MEGSGSRKDGKHANFGSAGTRKREEEVIEILDSSDEDSKMPPRPRARLDVSYNSSGPTSTKNDPNERPQPKRAKVDNSQSAIPQFCMLNPAPSPIKIFATKQDEETRKTSARDHWTWRHCWTLREMIGVDGDLGEMIDFIVISNFLIDFDYLLEEVPELLSIPNVLTVHGSRDSSEERWKSYATQPDGSCSADFVCRDPRAPKQSSQNPLRYQMDWGCHHTKMFLVGFSSRRLRVIVHTCNLRWNDVHLKAQGAFIQDFLPKTNHASKDESSEFEKTLLFYLESYHYNRQRQWQTGREPCSLLQQIRKYDFSSAKAILIPSIPGFHNPVQKNLLGYLKVRQAILTNLPAPRESSPSTPAPIYCQFSSIGSLSKPYLNKLWSAWDVPSVHRVGSKSTADGFQNLRLIYPTMEEILRSVEGVNGGASVPARIKNVQKPFLKPLYRKWASTSDPLDKSSNVPHIKTYYQTNGKRDSMQWFVLSSHNLSKAAWGEVQNGQWGETLKILHWELGVFICPDILGKARMVPVVPGGRRCQDDEAEIPLPYSLCPEAYSTVDKPWAVDAL